jgi:receptor protein-tyrosine kinase
MAAAGMVTPETPRSQISDEYRVIKRPLLLNAEGKGAVPVEQGNLIMVTSSMPGEGKTFSSINLAMSIAMELDKTVLLVDADVARPSVLRVLKLPPTKGLMDVLTGDKVDLSNVLLRTNVDKLSILPAGTSHSRATEFLASEAMVQLLEEIATRYSDRIVIFDSPPLLVTTEARTLASHMGQVVLVVEAEKTTHSNVKQALATIEACPVKLLMLNKGARGKAGGYGGYYGYYGYGGYGYGEKTDKA